MKKPCWTFTLAALFLFCSTSQAAVRDLPTDLAREVLSESVPTAFTVFPIHHQDFSARWGGSPPGGIQVSIAPGTIQWVRVSQLLVLPRARLRIAVQGWDSVTVRTAGYADSAEGGKLLEVPVALLALESSPIQLVLEKGNIVERHSLWLDYSPRSHASKASSPAHRVFADSSCSAYVPQVIDPEKLPSHHWAYFGCRVVRNRVPGGEVPSFEVYLHWEGAKGVLRSGLAKVDSLIPGLWLLRAGPERPVIQLETEKGEKLEIQFQIPKRLSYASLGLGVGPYSYRFEDGTTPVDQLMPITTIYGSYFLTESSRMVFFDALAGGSRWFNDMGFYFNNESTRALDERLSLNLLLGFHIIGFKAATGVAYRAGVPQGFEMVIRDALRVRWNASVGGFFYPPIAGKSYYNAWVRYGTSSIFGEINYIAWSELGPTDERVYSRSLGVTLGAPLFIFR